MMYQVDYIDCLTLFSTSDHMSACLINMYSQGTHVLIQAHMYSSRHTCTHPGTHFTHVGTHVLIQAYMHTHVDVHVYYVPTWTCTIRDIISYKHQSRDASGATKLRRYISSILLSHSHNTSGIFWYILVPLILVHMYITSETEPLI